MATQIIDMDDVTSVHFNNYVNDEVQEVRLNGTAIWTKPQSQPMYIEMIWNAPLISPKTFYLQTQNNVKYWNGTIEYSPDSVNWYTWDPTVSGQGTATSSASGHLYLRGSNNSHLCTNHTSATNGAWWFPYMADGNVEIKGNIETLLDYQTVAQGNHPVMDNYCYCRLFDSNTRISKAPEMLATTLSEHCYRNMFYQCSALIYPPSILPATTLPTSCYQGMFYGCTSLINAPSIKVSQTMGESSAKDMFRGCNNLEQLPEFKATQFNDMSCFRTFYGCGKIYISNTQTQEYTNTYYIGTPPVSTVGTPFRDMFGNTGGPDAPTNYGIYYTINTIV